VLALWAAVVSFLVIDPLASSGIGAKGIEVWNSLTNKAWDREAQPYRARVRDWPGTVPLGRDLDRGTPLALLERDAAEPNLVSFGVVVRGFACAV
jgi:hypothetical protein